MARTHTFTLPHENEDNSSVEWTYKCGLPPVMVQHEILRRVAPPVAARVAGTAAKGGGASIGPEMIGQMISALSDIAKPDHDWVINQLMTGVQVKKSGSAPWADVWNPGAPFESAMMFSDMTLMEFYEILKEVVEHTYGGFMVALSRTLNAGPPQA